MSPINEPTSPPAPPTPAATSAPAPEKDGAAVPAAPAIEVDGEALRARLRQRSRVPASTYRLQLHHEFCFRDAAAIVPYLAQLGITDVYCSPYLQARLGSTHGYDITNHNQLNPDLGTAEDYEAFTKALAEHHMGQVLDFVPNHMGVDPITNRWWRDVLASGAASPYARFFDIDWEPIKPELKGKVLLPMLGDHYGLVLERGELKLEFQNGGFVLTYFDHNLPIDPGQFPKILRHELDALKAELKEDNHDLQEFLSIITALEHLPSSRATSPEKIAERQRERTVAKERLGRLVAASAPIRAHIDRLLRIYNGEPGKAETFDRLHQLLDAQPYRVAYWKTAVHEINYRRFFDINDLAGVRMEDPAVFAATHQLTLKLIREGKVNGLRLDHLDGLFDPAGYVDRLQEAVLQEWVADLAPPNANPDDWRAAVRTWREQERGKEVHGLVEQPFYVVAEKILSAGEALPDAWPVHGTSGYDFMNDLNRLFVDPNSSKRLRQIYGRVTGQTTVFSSIVYECKWLITWTAMASELNVLAFALNRISEADRRLRDFTLASLAEALRETVAVFPVYRTYVNASGDSQADRQVIELALRRAQLRNPAMEPSVFRFLRAVLLPEPQDGMAEEEYRRRLTFAMKFQQYTGPVQAKGVEDTAFYGYNVLVSLNEVGGDPTHFGGPPAQFHEANKRRREHWPFAMLGTATHDTKRGEDVRARLNVLAEIPDEWARAVAKWARHNAPHRSDVDGDPAPDRNDEYLFYQTLLGAWPAEPASNSHVTAPEDLVKRLREYMTKATKEAKVHTSWINPNEAYDTAVATFVDKTLSRGRSAKFLASFLPFERRVARLGMINSLAQVVLKSVSPGVPDFYQGTEFWDLSLVDPDNRRKVEYPGRIEALKGFSAFLEGKGPAPVADLLETWEDGRIKLFITACCLHLRRELPDVVRQGEYIPLEAEGERASHIVALARRSGDKWVVAVVPRLVSRVLPPEHLLPLGSETWRETRLALPPGLTAPAFRQRFTGERVEATTQDGKTSVLIADVLRTCPVAVLVPDAG